MFCDNSAALLIANEPGVQRGARHYHRRYCYVRECIELGEINLLKVHTDDNLADPFTKALPKGKRTQHARSMGLQPIVSPSPPTVIRSKAKKLLALRKHPPYLEMVSYALVTLKERDGSSQYAIGKFIQDKYKDLPVNFKKRLLNHLKKLVASNKLVKVKASYKLPSTAKAVAAAKPMKEAAPAKKKPTAPAKTKAIPAKAKPAPKANPAAKAKPASIGQLSPWMPGKKAQAKVAPKTSGRLITLEEIIKHFGEQLEEAAGILRASRATLKRLCGGFGVSRWPYETDKSDTLNSIFKGSNEPHFTTNITHSPVTFSKHDGFIKLEEQIATRFQLKLGSFKLKYTDTEGDIILIACDSSLSVSVDDFRLSGGQTVIRLVLRLIIMRIILAPEPKQHPWTFPWAPFWSSAVGWS
ncbi:retrovirus-related pol polyprotein from transposon TNT 1-94 [Tanacetum coccineum]